MYENRIMKPVEIIPRKSKGKMREKDWGWGGESN
jgi:hypothetical protein